MSRESLAKFVEKYLAFDITCRHCNSHASLRLLATEPNHVVGAYCCPDGFVSRIIYFSFDDGLDRFYAFLLGQLGSGEVQRKDLRVASRYGWELGEEAAVKLKELTEGTKSLREIYWTRYPRTEAEKGRGVFLCSNPGCGKLFVQDIASKEKLCPQCH